MSGWKHHENPGLAPSLRDGSPGLAAGRRDSVTENWLQGSHTSYPSMLVRSFAILTFVALLSTSLPALARDYGSFGEEYYRSSDGSLVHRPTRDANPAFGPVTADCRDGTHSYSHHQRGTCSGHGGVAQWRSDETADTAPSPGMPAVLGPPGHH